MNDHVVTQQAHPGRAARHSFGNQTASNLADSRDFKDLFDLRITDETLANFGLQQAAGSGPDVVQEIVDHRVVSNFDTFLIRRRPRRGICPHVKAYDWRASRFSKT